MINDDPRDASAEADSKAGGNDLDDSADNLKGNVQEDDNKKNNDLDNKSNQKFINTESIDYQICLATKEPK